FKRVYDDNTTVTLTAPQTASGNTFVKWQKDGTDLTSNQEIKVTLDADVSVTAIYKTPSIERILTFYSSNPDSNVVISVSPEDINGQSNGTTPFKRIYFDNTNITIKAPSSALGNKFLKWLKSDVHYYYNGQSISFTLDSDISVTAVFKSESCNYYDSLALVALYNATKGDEWTNNSGWLIDSVKYWYGITLDTYGKVIGIELTKNNLQDSLPIDIGNLDSLQNLYLNENLLSGTIPSTIGNLSHLQILSLYNNHLTGTIPSEIGNLKNLQKIYLGSNYLTDSIPLEIGNLTNLTMLQLSNNYLTGTIPSTIFNLSHLQYLILMANGFSGEIPSSVGNLSDLKWLNLKYNAFSGQVPSEIADLTNLNLLMLGYNNFSGEIPEGIWGLKNLMYFGLEGNQFTGDIPSQINNKTYLYELNIENNLFNSLPDLSPLSNLQTLSIQNNNFTFKDIVPNMNVAKRSFTYSPQAKVDTIQHYLVGPGDSLRLSVSIKDSADSYQWYRNGDTISGANDSVYTIKNYEESNDFGVYTYKVRNNIATALTLESNDIYVDEKGSKQNVALSSNGGIAYAQSELTINGEKQYAGLINDGFRTTKWHASWLMIYPQMLAIKLNDTYAIDSVVIWWGSNNSMGSTLFLFADTNWVAVHPEKHDKREIIPKLYRQVVPFGGQKADSIQLVIYYYYYSNDSPLTIGEVEVYGSKLNAIQNIKVEKSFIVYPNPTKTSIYIRFKDFSFKEISIIIYDNQGKVLVTKYFNQTPSEPIKLNMANYPMGLYYIHIITNQGNAIKKFIIKR
ncbi:MAG: leucine-rich repeat domain-containing protein, partial [Bacteroidales bacterium]|nr:leucine-rich repeat domain-containing protein [Bacteroidales bacterium]